ncbi:hypothetical protein AYO38_00565 [bacterium SCGC AG-212-C10]|nr:hypothetical protein AYO38_00565 [bacterium SCGC AG-212-C10]
MSAASISQTIDQADMNEFASLRSRLRGVSRASGLGSHHTDPTVAREAGLSGTVAQALHYCAYIGQLMLDEAGKRWLEGAELEMKFIRPVYAGDTVEVKLRGDSEDERTIECLNQNGELIAFGKVVLGDA